MEAWLVHICTSKRSGPFNKCSCSTYILTSLCSTNDLGGAPKCQRSEQCPGQSSLVFGKDVGRTRVGHSAMTHLTRGLSVQSVRLVLAEMQDLQTRLAALDIVVRQVSAILHTAHDYLKSSLARDLVYFMPILRRVVIHCRNA